MSEKYYTVDAELFYEFVDETLESLLPLEAELIALGQTGGNQRSIDSIFRPIHSLKGSAAYFGMMKSQQLIHLMESILHKMRSNNLSPDAAVIKLLLKGLDQLKTTFNEASPGNEPVPNMRVFEGLCRDLETIANDNQSATDDEISGIISTAEELERHMLEEHREEFGRIVRYLNKLNTPGKPEISDNPTPHLLSTLSSLMKYSAEELTLNESYHEIYLAFSSLLQQSKDEPTCDILRAAIDEYETFVNQIGYDALLHELLSEKVENLKNEGVWHIPNDSEAQPDDISTPQESEPNPEPAPSAAQKNKSDKTMRIAEKSLDTFFEHVGELVIIVEMFRHINSEMNKFEMEIELGDHFNRVLESFENLTGKLQEGIFSIRKVPVGNVLKKIPRLVKETSEETGKSVVFEITGEDLTIDKSYIELLDAPITHMIRNAVDHGIEMPSTREQLGKPEQGMIKVCVTSDEETIQLVISDDGNGLDIEKISEKAVSLGIMNSHESLTHDRLVDFLFQPGFSTADAVTNVSGRGVGMDVVKQEIESAGGRIQVDTIPGKGAEFRLTLPQITNTQIVMGFLVKARESVYVIQLEDVSESFKICRSDITPVDSSGLVINRNDTFIPLYDLNATLNAESFSKEILPSENASVVTVEIEKTLNAFIVDEILGVQKVVVKESPHYIAESNFYAGTAIMGDGRVAMVLNCPGLVASPTE